MTLLFTLGSAFPDEAYEVKVGSELEKRGPANDLNLECNALGECTCDITLGSCDAYCDCDKDCGEETIKIWQANYDDYGKKNAIGSLNQSNAKCLDTKYFVSETSKTDPTKVQAMINKRMGMQV